MKPAIWKILFSAIVILWIIKYENLKDCGMIRMSHSCDPSLAIISIVLLILNIADSKILVLIISGYLLLTRMSYLTPLHAYAREEVDMLFISYYIIRPIIMIFIICVVVIKYSKKFFNSMDIPDTNSGYRDIISALIIFLWIIFISMTSSRK